MTYKVAPAPEEAGAEHHRYMAFLPSFLGHREAEGDNEEAHQYHLGNLSRMERWVTFWIERDARVKQGLYAVDNKPGRSPAQKHKRVFLATTGAGMCFGALSAYSALSFEQYLRGLPRLTTWQVLLFSNLLGFIITVCEIAAMCVPPLCFRAGATMPTSAPTA